MALRIPDTRVRLAAFEWLQAQVSITTAPGGPYDDRASPEGLLLYRYRGTDPDHHENVGLRKAMARQVPLVYFYGLVPGRYLAVWPVYIVADQEGGLPTVRNGVALCKLHHAAFDRHFIGIRPDYVVEVRRDLLEEEDGPMLVHGLKGMHRTRILVPRSAAQRPDPELLERRYEAFRAA